MINIYSVEIMIKDVEDELKKFTDKITHLEDIDDKTDCIKKVGVVSALLKSLINYKVKLLDPQPETKKIKENGSVKSKVSKIESYGIMNNVK